MRKSKFSERQIVEILKEADARVPVARCYVSTRLPRRPSSSGAASTVARRCRT